MLDLFGNELEPERMAYAGAAAALVGRDGIRGRLGVHLLIQHAGFDGPRAVEAPTGGAHVLKHADFDAIGRFEAGNVLLHETVEVFAGFILQDDTFGEQAVAESVLRGTLFGEWSGRSRRFGAVGAG
jgi:hypothetical protein